MVRFRIENSSWLRIGLSSIALHLAVLSTLSAVSSEEPIELVYLPAVQISQHKEQKVSAPSPARAEAPTSGTTTPTDSTFTTQNSFMHLRDSLYRELNSRLRRRSRQLEMQLALKFSSEGSLEKSEIVKSSGQSEVDAEVLSILSTSTLYSSQDLANLKIQLPIRLR